MFAKLTEMNYSDLWAFNHNLAYLEFHGMESWKKKRLAGIDYSFALIGPHHFGVGRRAFRQEVINIMRVTCLPLWKQVTFVSLYESKRNSCCIWFITDSVKEGAMPKTSDKFDIDFWAFLLFLAYLILFQAAILSLFWLQFVSNCWK